MSSITKNTISKAHDPGLMNNLDGSKPDPVRPIAFDALLKRSRDTSTDHSLNKRQHQLSPEEAAITIQRGWRAYVEHSGHFMDNELFAKAKTYVKDRAQLALLPRASSGKTRVFLPSDSPVVIKCSGEKFNQKRFKKMQQARAICKKNDYTHLTIPKARVYQGVIIEDRVPIIPDDLRTVIGCYYEHRDQFTEAVQEFTGFICQSHFSDIVHDRDRYRELFTTETPRYDNVTLYLEEETGKIALIDLERFNPLKHSKEITSQHCFAAAHQAITFFPYHFEEILEVVKQFDPELEGYQEELRKLKDNIVPSFDILYKNHVEFLREKGITTEHPGTMYPIAREKIESVQEKIIQFLIRLHQEGKPLEWNADCELKGLLGEYPEEAIAEFKKVFPQIINQIFKSITHYLQLRKDSLKPVSERDLVRYRSVFWRHDRGIPQTEVADLCKNIFLIGGEEIFEPKEESFARFFIVEILQELYKQGELAFVHPNLGVHGDYMTCIFC